MDKIICPYCGNKKFFYKEVRVIAKVKVFANGKRGKRLYEQYEDEDYLPLYCGECKKEIKDKFYCN